MHLAGRTGRHGAAGTKRGTALTIAPVDEARRLGLLTSQLAVSIKPMRPPEWMAEGLARLEAKRAEERAERDAIGAEAREEERQARKEAEALVAAMAAVQREQEAVVEVEAGGDAAEPREKLPRKPAWRNPAWSRSKK